jgi:DNA-binding MarR family transcriptional regulator
MTSPRQTAAMVIDNIPLLMRLLRTKFREKRTGDLSIVQFRTLIFVDANQGASLSEAAAHIGLGLPSMSKLVESMVTRELLRRDLHGVDRRRICLSLTDKGKNELDGAYRHTQAYFTEKLAELTEDERMQIIDSLNLMKKVFTLDQKKRIPEPDKEESVPG